MKTTLAQAVLSLQPNITALFGPHLSSGAHIIPASTPGYPAQIQQRWTDYNAPSYNFGAIKPSNEKDIQEIIRIARSHSIPFFTLAGGHGVSDYHSFNGMAIDLGAFKSIEFSKDNSHVTIGGSTKIYQLIKPLYDAGKELPLGSCACVGVVGATLGGGIGGLQGHQGLMLDSLESVRIITATGELVEASESENKDLFWAVRGAGSNFGIVTSATYSLPDISNSGMYMNADFLLPASANISFWQAMKSFDRDMPSRLAINAVVVYNRVANQVSFSRLEKMSYHTDSNSP
jgi:FAD/FMN-containing dehydrogenase